MNVNPFLHFLSKQQHDTHILPASALLTQRPMSKQVSRQFGQSGHVCLFLWPSDEFQMSSPAVERIRYRRAAVNPSFPGSAPPPFHLPTAVTTSPGEEPHQAGQTPSPES